LLVYLQTFSFIQYSQGEQKYNIVDENAKVKKEKGKEKKKKKYGI
jgi:hypothetical protein